MTLYRPGATNGSVYRPSVPDTVSYRAPVSTSVATSLTLGTTAPAGSLTRPEMIPRNCCPRQITVSALQIVPVHQILRIPRTTTPPHLALGYWPGSLWQNRGQTELSTVRTLFSLTVGRRSGTVSFCHRLRAWPSP